MKAYFFILKIILYTFIFLGIFNSSHAKVSKFNYDAKNISNYFSGLVSFDDFDYEDSQTFFKKLDNFENKNTGHSSKFLQSLVNLGKYNQAYRYAKKLEENKTSNFESNIFLTLYELKKQNYIKAQSYADKLKPDPKHLLIYDIIKISINTWVKLAQSNNIRDIELLDQAHPAYSNLIMIQKVFSNCYLKNAATEEKFKKFFENKESNFARYNFFFSNYLYNNDRKEEAIKFIDSSSNKYPRNLLINQFAKSVRGLEKNNNLFNCQNISNVLAEIFYVLANVLSSQNHYALSNFYINLSKFLNPNFDSYNTLLAENFLVLKKNKNAKAIYKNLLDNGSVYKWYAAKQIANIMDQEKNTNSINFLSNIYKKMKPEVHDTFDFANFLRNKENYKKSIELYSEILGKITVEHKLYPAVLERRGMSYERINEWELSEKDLLASLDIVPDEPYVMNYLAYTWVEKNKNIEKALDMLRKANDLKKNNGYITDSLGWALYKLNNFSEAKKYLQMAIVLMPTDPIINDHFADCLWMNNDKIQARYYWRNVLKSEDADEELKIKAKRKLLFGLENT
tara:strand:+ start:426 stop:2126 length:1701 start_codon:yes stop_codon:yes gene_type:complete